MLSKNVSHDYYLNSSSNQLKTYTNPFMPKFRSRSKRKFQRRNSKHHHYSSPKVGLIPTSAIFRFQDCRNRILPSARTPSKLIQLAIKNRIKFKIRKENHIKLLGSAVVRCLKLSQRVVLSLQLYRNRTALSVIIKDRRQSQASHQNPLIKKRTLKPITTRQIEQRQRMQKRMKITMMRTRKKRMKMKSMKMRKMQMERIQYSAQNTSSSREILRKTQASIRSEEINKKQM